MRKVEAWKFEWNFTKSLQTVIRKLSKCDKLMSFCGQSYVFDWIENEQMLNVSQKVERIYSNSGK